MRFAPSEIREIDFQVRAHSFSWEGDWKVWRFGKHCLLISKIYGTAAGPRKTPKKNPKPSTDTVENFRSLLLLIADLQRRFCKLSRSFRDSAIILLQMLITSLFRTETPEFLSAVLADDYFHLSSRSYPWIVPSEIRTGALTVNEYVSHRSLMPKFLRRIPRANQRIHYLWLLESVAHAQLEMSCSSLTRPYKQITHHFLSFQLISIF